MSKENLIFDAVITIQERKSKQDNIYQVMIISIPNKKTGELLDIHEVYIKDNLRQVIQFITDINK